MTYVNIALFFNGLGAARPFVSTSKPLRAGHMATEKNGMTCK